MPLKNSWPIPKFIAKMAKAARLNMAEGWAAVAAGQTEARSAEGPSEQRAVRQPDPSEASGQPQKKPP